VAHHRHDGTGAAETVPVAGHQVMDEQVQTLLLGIDAFRRGAENVVIMDLRQSLLLGEKVAEIVVGLDPAFGIKGREADGEGF